jgi:hypothetical protein
MPLHPLHEKKKTKNYALMIIIASLMVLFFTVTIIKISEVNSNVEIKSEK